MSHVNFDRVTFDKFKQAYNEAVKEDKKTFFFNNDEYLTKYAYYLIEYLDGKFK